MAAAQVFKNLKGKIVIITGASAGIGEAIAIEFARQGCHLTLCGRDENRLRSVADKCLSAGERQIKVECVTGDIVSQDTQNAVVNKTIDAFGRLDILVNNAGTSIMHDPLDVNLEDFNLLMKTNVEAVFFLTQLAIPHLIKTQGNVVNMSSFISSEAAPGMMPYAMTKAAVDSFTKSLALFLAPQKVRVNAVNPGSIVSMIYRRGERALDDEQYEKFCKKASSLHPLGNRMGLVNEVADAVVFLASDSASFTTGQTLYVDGGRSKAGATFSD